MQSCLEASTGAPSQPPLPAGGGAEANRTWPTLRIIHHVQATLVYHRHLARVRQGAV
jgi:hypothetical protein